MITVYKYPIPGPPTWSGSDMISMPLPQGAEILAVQDQRGTACLWAKVDPDRPREHRRFHLYGTGREIPPDANLRHIATFQQQAGLLVWHLFEEIGP